jgi:hypothetical protein
MAPASASILCPASRIGPFTSSASWRNVAVICGPTVLSTSRSSLSCCWRNDTIWSKSAA